MQRPILVLCALALGASSLALLAGCQRDGGNPLAPRAAAPAAKKPDMLQRGPTTEELTAGMVEAATEGKSQTPVALKFDLLGRPVQGEPLSVAIALLPQESADPVTVEVSAADGLALGAGERRFEFSAVEPSQVYRHRITVTPTAEGVFLLTLTVSLNHDQLADTRTFSVPIIVAPPPAPTPTATLPAAKPATPTG